MSFDNFMDKVTLVPKKLDLAIFGHQGTERHCPLASFSYGNTLYLPSNTVINKELEKVVKGPMAVQGHTAETFTEEWKNDYFPLMCKQLEWLDPESGEVRPVLFDFEGREIPVIEKAGKVYKDVLDDKYDKYIDKELIREHGLCHFALFILAYFNDQTDIKDCFDDERKIMIAYPDTLRVTYGLFFPRRRPDGSVEKMNFNEILEKEGPK